MVTLHKGNIELAEGQKAKGPDHYPARDIEYAADLLNLKFGGDGWIAGITGARLRAISPTARTTVTTERVNLDFLSTGD